MKLSVPPPEYRTIHCNGVSQSPLPSSPVAHAFRRSPTADRAASPKSRRRWRDPFWRLLETLSSEGIPHGPWTTKGSETHQRAARFLAIQTATLRFFEHLLGATARFVQAPNTSRRGSKRWTATDDSDVGHKSPPLQWQYLTRESRRRRA